MNQTVNQRDQEWLEDIFQSTWNEHFSDVKRVNHIRVEFGRRAKRRLGSISVDRNNPGQSIVRVNGWFRDEEVPEFLIRSVIVHELCHYAHGFNSGSKDRKHQYPHAGGVVRREFAERGLENLYEQQQQWLHKNWPSFISKRYTAHRKPVLSTRRKRSKLLRMLIS